MWHDLGKYIKQPYIDQLAVGGIVCVWFIFLAATAITTQHVAFNLEPYPDALYYVGTALSIAQGNGIVFDPNISYKPEIAPAYPIFLSFFFNQRFSLSSLILCNTLLGLIGLFALWRVLSDRAPRYRALLLIFFLSHPLFWWVPTLPISENLVWTVVSLLIFFLHAYHKSQRRFWLFALVLGSLVLAATKFSVIPIALAFLSIVAWELIRGLRPPLVVVSATVLAVTMAITFHLQVNSFVRLLLSKDLPFFQFSHIPHNMMTYTGILAGISGRFLWQPLRFTLPLYILILLGYFVLYKRNNRFAMHSVLVLLSHFPLLLFFYDINLRYIISALPVVCCMGSLVLTDARQSRENRRLTIAALLVASILNGVLQAPLFKQLASQTIFRSSRAWQYEAAQEISLFYQQSQQKPDYIFTALPPQLFTYYQNGLSYQLRPLSPQQEFISKGVNVWQFPEFSPSIDQHAYIASLLASNKKIWVSNAYITHAAQVATDFELLKKQFTVTPIHPGCQATCDIFELS